MHSRTVQCLPSRIRSPILRYFVVSTVTADTSKVLIPMINEDAEHESYECKDVKIRRVDDMCCHQAELG